MSDFLIGPNPCHECGEEYGQHKEMCPHFPKPRPAVTFDVAKARELADLFDDPSPRTYAPKDVAALLRAAADAHEALTAERDRLRKAIIQARAELSNINAGGRENHDNRLNRAENFLDEAIEPTTLAGKEKA